MKSTVASILVALFTIVSLSVEAKDIVFKNKQEREAAIANARVWLSPSWISSDFQFSSSLDLYNGPYESDPLIASLMSPVVNCITTEKDQKSSFGGKSSKFNCRLANASQPQNPIILLDKNNDDLKLKVKYSPASRVNNEVYGEVLGTRILWALGFAADRIFFVEQVRCYGCTQDPYKDRKVNPDSLTNPIVFSPTAIEIKYPGSKMVLETVDKNVESEDGSEVTKITEGWSFKELMKNLPADPHRKYEQYVQRDALRLLAAFLHHLDLKPDNQRLLCPADPDQNGRCPVQPILMIQDVGSVFGVKVSGFRLDRVNLKTWSKLPVWKDATLCQTNLDRSFLKDSSMRNVIVSEAGRQFLSRLLVGFSSGAAGRRRVEDLFRAARLDVRGRDGETIQAWTETFLDKVKQIQYPMGEQNPNFKCPQ